MDYLAIKIEAAKLAYIGMTAEQKAAAINAGTYSITQDIPTDLAKMAFIYTVAYDWGELVGIVNGAITASQIKKKRATTFHELLNTQSPIEVAATDAAGAAWWAFIQTLLTEMVADGTITTPGRAAFEALRLRLVPLWQKFGDRELDYNDILIAEALP